MVEKQTHRFSKAIGAMLSNRVHDLGKQVMIKEWVGHFGIGWLYKTQQTDLAHPCHASDICGFLSATTSLRSAFASESRKYRIYRKIVTPAKGQIQGAEGGLRVLELAHPGYYRAWGYEGIYEMFESIYDQWLAGRIAVLGEHCAAAPTGL